MFGQRSSGGFDQILHRPRPSFWQQLYRAPCAFLAKKLYHCLRRISPRPLTDGVKIVCISDTHNSQPDLPSGDVLIHAGDLTQSGSVEEVQATLDWLREQPFHHKIVVAGNHDAALASEKAKKSLKFGDIIYLENEDTTITCINGRRLRVFGSPLSQKHGNWAFQYPRGTDIWSDLVPIDTDVLITHGPPLGHLDLSFGCRHLMEEVWRVRPDLHVFGHVHEGYGQEVIQSDALQAAYEQTVADKGGIRNLCPVFYHFVCSLWQSRREAKCIMVNPSMVGGLRDDNKREPVTVLL